jgi:hypothetical protein
MLDLMKYSMAKASEVPTKESCDKTEGMSGTLLLIWSKISQTAKPRATSKHGRAKHGRARARALTLAAPYKVDHMCFPNQDFRLTKAENY